MRRGPFLSGVVTGLVSAAGLLAGRVFFRAVAASPVAAAVRPVAAVVPMSLAATDLDRLRARRLTIPVAGYDESALRDSFREPRVGHVHEAIDLVARRGTAVRAADDGTIRRLATNGRGGISVYEVDPSGTYGYYYAHLDHYAAFLHEGQDVRKGDVVGYVGSTGNAVPSAPHLHFAIYRIDDAGRWWDGTPVNPYDVWAPVVARAAR